MKHILRTFAALLTLLSLTLPLMAAAPQSEQIPVYLTWQNDPQTTMTVQWITGSDDRNSSVKFRELHETQWYCADGRQTTMPQGNNQLIHTVELIHLRPGGTYCFEVGKHPKRYKFRTISNNPGDSIKFVVGGDVYHDSIELFKETNCRAAQTAPHFALIGGDISYAASKSTRKKQKKQFWMNFITAWSETMITPEGYLIPILPVLGNHDVTGRYDQPKSHAPFYYALFATPGRKGYFALDFRGDLTIIGLDSGHSNPIPGYQTEWLKTELEKRENVPYKFAFYHVPAYPSVRSFDNERIIPIRENWVPLFEKYGLTAAFEHHDHAYKRTHRIFQGAINPEKGVLYLGDGAWGVGVPRETKNPEGVWYLAKTASKRHFILVDIQGGNRTYTAIDSDGKIIDQLVEEAPAVLDHVEKISAGS